MGARFPTGKGEGGDLSGLPKTPNSLDQHDHLPCWKPSPAGWVYVTAAEPVRRRLEPRIYIPGSEGLSMGAELEYYSPGPAENGAAHGVRRRRPTTSQGREKRLQTNTMVRGGRTLIAVRPANSRRLRGGYLAVLCAALRKDSGRVDDVRLEGGNVIRRRPQKRREGRLLCTHRLTL